jgi:hypothetical protein
MHRSTRISTAFALFSFALLTLADLPAQAQGDDIGAIFTVRDVALDETAATAAAARSAALEKGQRDAFGRLVARLTRSIHRSRLAGVDAATLGFLVGSLRIENEKTSDVRYLADLTVSFKPEAVRGYLRSAGVPYAEVPSAPVAVIPVMEADGQYRLWENPNPWREAWRDFRPGAGLVPVVAPVGDLADFADLGTAEALAGDPASFAPFLERYGAGSALVAIASFGPPGPGALRLSVTGSRIGADGPPLLVNLTAAEGEAADAFLRRAVATIVELLEDDWIASNAVTFGVVSRLRVAVPIGSLGDWVAVRTRLERVPSISALIPVALTASSAEIEIEHLGTRDQLVRTLERFDLAMEETGLEQPPDGSPSHIIRRTDG